MNNHFEFGTWHNGASFVSLVSLSWVLQRNNAKTFHWGYFCNSFSSYLMNHCSPKMNEQFVQFLAAIRRQTCVCFLQYLFCLCLTGSVKWINVPNPDAEPLWSCEIRRALQCGRRPPQRNQTGESNFSTSDLQLLCRHSQHVFSDFWKSAQDLKNTKKENIKVTFESSDTKLQKAERLSWC